MLNLFLIFISILLLSPNLYAEIYKWTDENGKVHFSDEPPKIKSKKAEVLDVKTSKISAIEFPRLRKPKPIPYANDESLRTILLEHVSFKLPKKELLENPKIGKAYHFSSYDRRYRSPSEEKNRVVQPCKFYDDISLGQVAIVTKNAGLSRLFNELVESYGYSAYSSSDKKFALQEARSVDLSVAAEIIDFRMAMCGERKGISAYMPSQSSTYMKVKWEVFDNLRREVVSKFETEGVDDHFSMPARNRGAEVSFKLAFQYSLENLLSNKEFVVLLTGTDDSSSQKKPVSSRLEKVKVVYGEENKLFVKKIEGIKQSTATIRTTFGHGSGFLVSDDGYLLTNHHVVSGSSKVLVVIDGEEFFADVIDSNAQRDVALLSVKSSKQLKGLKLSKKPAKLGESIYVIGTPLDEQLDFSISKGIVSAKRKIDSQSFYQTDAAVNPGNSGGPVFDEYGNVIGLTVSGYFTRDGGSKNINYVIPIADALAVVGID